LPVGQEKGELVIGNKAIKFVTDKAGSSTYKVISTYEKLYEFVMD
jgi:predicted solute-binding protein